MLCYGDLHASNGRIMSTDAYVNTIISFNSLLLKK